MVVDDDADDEIVIKMPAAEKDEECSSEEEEDGDDEDEDEDEDSESEEPSGEGAEAEWKSSLCYCGLGTLSVRVHCVCFESQRAALNCVQKSQCVCQFVGTTFTKKLLCHTPP